MKPLGFLPPGSLWQVAERNLPFVLTSIISSGVSLGVFVCICPLCSLLPSGNGLGVGFGYLNTEPHRVFGALGCFFFLFSKKKTCFGFDALNNVGMHFVFFRDCGSRNVSFFSENYYAPFFPEKITGKGWKG